MPTTRLLSHRTEGIANNGSIMQIVDHLDPSRTQSFSYDGFHRLLTAETQGSHWGLAWTYDRYGNSLSQSATKGTAPTRSISVATSSNRLPSWTYDRAGNVLHDGGHAYAYDANGQIIAVDGVEYSYDGQGARVASSAGGVTTLFPFGVGQYTASNGWERLEVRNQKSLLASYSSGTTSFYFNDHLNSVRAVSDIGGETQLRATYPFGEPWYGQSTSEYDYAYTGALRDSESGNDYFGARHYASSAGRWLSPDLIMEDLANPQLLNKYQYVGNNPSNFRDAFGFWRYTAAQIEQLPILKDIMDRAREILQERNSTTGKTGQECFESLTGVAIEAFTGDNTNNPIIDTSTDILGAVGAFVPSFPDRIFLDPALLAPNISSTQTGIDFWATILLHETANWAAHATGRTVRASDEFYNRSGDQVNDAGLAWEECFADQAVPIPPGLERVIQRLYGEQPSKGDQGAAMLRPQAGPGWNIFDLNQLANGLDPTAPSNPQTTVTTRITYGDVVPPGEGSP